MTAQHGEDCDEQWTTAILDAAERGESWAVEYHESLTRKVIEAVCDVIGTAVKTGGDPHTALLQMPDMDEKSARTMLRWYAEAADQG